MPADWMNDDAPQDGAAALTLLGHEALHAGETIAAEGFYEAALAMEICADHVDGQAADWGNLGIAKGLNGAIADGIRCLGRAYRLHCRVRDTAGMAVDLMNLAELLTSQGRWAGAVRCLAGAARAFEQLRQVDRAVEARRRLSACRSVLRLQALDPATN